MPTTPQQLDPCELLPWDSAFFGFPIARVRATRLTDSLASTVDAWCRANEIRCLYFLADNDSETALTAARHGYDLIETRVTLTHSSPSAALAPDVRPFRPDDLPALEHIAAESHTDTRFYADPRFPRDLARQLYVEWIRKACRGASHAVLVADHAGQPAGYVTCDLHDHATRGAIGLIAVASERRGHGAGHALVTAALAHFATLGTAPVTVVTQQRNAPGLRLYARCGFTPTLTQLYYHRWY